MVEIRYDGATLLKLATDRLQIHFSDLIAETSIWANPEVFKILQETNGEGVWFPNTRRVRLGQNEKKGETINEIKFDDNTYANNAIKRAIGLSRTAIVGFETCHIWPDSCYNHNYHTFIPNLVLIPRAIASLTDHDKEIQIALQYRSFELYGWFPKEYSQPIKPEYYPKKWRDPEPINEEIKKSINKRFSIANVSNNMSLYTPKPRNIKSIEYSDKMTLEEKNQLIDRLKSWAKQPSLIVHKTIALVVNSETGLQRDILTQKIKNHTGNKNPYGTIGSLLTSKGNAYGRIFLNNYGTIIIHPELKEEIVKFVWHI